MAAARDEVEEEHQQALERAKQRRAGAHAEKRAWRERCVRPSGALSRVPSDPAPHAPRSARAPLTLRPTQASALLQPGRAGCRRGRGARWARRGRHVLHGIGSVASVGPKGRHAGSPRQVAPAGAGAVLRGALARCWLARCRCRLARCRLAPAPALKGPTSPPSSAPAVSSSRRTRGRSVRPPPP